MDRLSRCIMAIAVYGLGCIAMPAAALSQGTAAQHELTTAGHAARLTPTFDPQKPSSVSERLAREKDAISSIQGLVTIFAIIMGGIWAYFKIIRGRVYYMKLEPVIGGKILAADDYQCVVIKVEVKNVGLSRVYIDTDLSAIEVMFYSTAEYMPEFHNAFASDLGAVRAVYLHRWIEPGECICEERLVALPNEKFIALILKLRILEDVKRSALRRSGVEWDAVAVVASGDILPEAQAASLPVPLRAKGSVDDRQFRAATAASGTTAAGTTATGTTTDPTAAGEPPRARSERKSTQGKAEGA